jgi:DNA-binding transcriptional LysR family regulator
LFPGLYDAILSACNTAGFSPRVGQEAPRIVSTPNLVAAGLGISLVPESLQRMRMDGVVFRRVAGAAQPKAALYLKRLARSAQDEPLDQKRPCARTRS